MSSANLPPQYIEAEEQFRKAGSPSEKLEALEKMLALIPKHKGTEKIQVQIKKRITKWKDQTESQKKVGAKRTDPSHVPREGAAQVVLIGPVNTGKSAILSAITNSSPQVAEYPFTTRIPQPGMMFHNDIPVQLVDSPAFDPSVTERWISTLIRNADMSLMVLDISRDDLLEQMEASEAVLDDLKIELVPPEESKVFSDDGWAKIPCIYLGNKCESKKIDERLSVLRELIEDLPEINLVSAEEGTGLENLKRLIVGSLGLIRVYSKRPGKEPDMTAPFVLKEGSTISELARMVHKDIGAKLRFARVWGKSVFDGQRVSHDYELLDGDVVELHA
ncbi:MAG: GTPase [bacterium]